MTWRGCCQSTVTSLDWFWVRHGLLFPSNKREQAFFAFKTQDSTVGTLLLYFLSFVVLFLASIAGLSLITEALFVDADILQRDVLFREQGAVDVVAFWTLAAVGLLFLLFAAVGACWRPGRQKIWLGCCWILGFWEFLFFVQSILQLFGWGILELGPVFPFDAAMLGGGSGNGASRRTQPPPSLFNITLEGDAACRRNFTGETLIVNATCTFNITTAAAVMMYSGYMDGCLALLPQLIVPWAILVVLAANNVMFQARQIAWLALLPLCCLAISAFSIVGPASNFNFMGSISSFIGCDPTFNFIFWIMVSISSLFLLLTASILFNMTYIHERNVREMYFWTDFTRMRRDQLSTLHNPFTKQHLSKWLHRHAVDTHGQASRSTNDSFNHQHGRAFPATSLDGDDAVPQEDMESFWEINAKDVKLVRKKAGGASGTVWYAQYQGKPVAAKVLHAFLDAKGSDNHFAANELATETTILAQLRHANVVKFLGLSLHADVATGRQGAIIVTEWCPENLDSWLTTWRFAAELLETSIGIARGMEYLHHKGIIHRDLKPQNVLLDAHNTVKICDFGISVGDTDSGNACDKKSTQHQSHHLVGTPGFIAPEVYATAAGSNLLGPITQKVDVYAFGVILWEIFANGAHSFKVSRIQLEMLNTDDDVHSLLIAKGLPVPRRELLDTRCSKQVADFMCSCWRTMQSHRPDFSEAVTVLSTQLHYLLAGIGDDGRGAGSIQTNRSIAASESTFDTWDSRCESLSANAGSVPLPNDRTRPMLPYCNPRPKGRAGSIFSTNRSVSSSTVTREPLATAMLLTNRQASDLPDTKNRRCCGTAQHRVDAIVGSLAWRRLTCQRCWVRWGLQFADLNTENDFLRRVVVNDRFFSTVRIVFLLIAVVIGASGVYLSVALSGRAGGEPDLFGARDLTSKFVGAGAPLFALSLWATILSFVERLRPYWTFTGIVLALTMIATVASAISSYFGETSTSMQAYFEGFMSHLNITQTQWILGSSARAKHICGTIRTVTYCETLDFWWSVGSILGFSILVFQNVVALIYFGATFALGLSARFAWPAVVIALGHILCTGWLYDLALSASVNGMDFLYTLFGEGCSSEFVEFSNSRGVSTKDALWQFQAGLSVSIVFLFAMKVSSMCSMGFQFA
eukprot:INCI3141.4.p1 GENE.INCI3141.4~~INCI3141.4.p1  ORF type:complete len:1146 (+),score=156.16 INCI3141.4:117-3554(+)